MICYIKRENIMEEEISLRELIEILLKGWKFIAVITVISILSAGVFSFYIAGTSYEAKTVLMASYATDKLVSSNSNSDDVEGILDSISMYPPMTIQTYKEQLKSPEILQNTIDELGLQEKEINVEGLSKMISLEIINDTNLIAIKVTYSDPEVAAAIANTLANRFTDFITDMSYDRTSKSSDFLKSQLEIEKAKLDEASLELKQFLSQPRGVDELKGEVSSMLSMINSYKTQTVQKEVELIKIDAGIEAVTKEISRTPEVLTTKKTLDNDSLLNQIVSETGSISIVDTSQLIMESEEINENYQSLNMMLSDLNIHKAELEHELNEIMVKIDENQSTLEASQQELAEKNYEKTLINRKVGISNNTYAAFLQKYEESLIAESTKIGESSIDIVSKAIVPKSPVGPRKMLNLAIGAVLGMMIGVFGAFFRAYWIESGKAQ
jgi:uncharacterized protein involved in exopolysaccharide biosynthesis